ncbi:unnamed protein product [Arabidopsis halleri]
MSFILRAIALLFFSISSFLYTSGSLTRNLCYPDQRDTLLEFKNEFEIQDPLGFITENIHDIVISIDVTSYPKTESWRNNTDCCFWDGVTCDVKSGDVIGVDLSCSCLHGHFKANSSLFRLPHLRTLNLAYNNFIGSPIPSGFRNLMRLERLNLSRSSFSGEIPMEILHLTKMVSLDLTSSDITFSRPLFTKTPFLRLLAQKLINLRELDMSYVNISSEIPQNISNQTSLRSLRLHDCYIFGRLPRNVLLSPTIQSIDLSMNPDLECSLPEFNGNNSLVYLDLSETSISGNIPDSISNLKHLNVLEFHDCSLTGKIPPSIGNLSHLTSLTLSSNTFAGEIPSSFQNLNQMTNLDVEDNKLGRNFPILLLNLTKMLSLSLSYNQFAGTLPPNMSSLSNLESFVAIGNSFVGTFPSSLFTITSLTYIDLKNNQLNGTLEFENMSTPSKLQTLSLGNNNFRGPIPRAFSNLLNLEMLDLSLFNIQGPVDFSIFSHLKSLQVLFLSHLNTTTSIELKAILSCIKSVSSLDLSANHISVANTSSFTDLSSQLNYLNLSGCGIRAFPEFIRIQQQMRRLDLSNNRITDQVPGWLWSLPELQMVYLSNNSFSGFNGFTRDLSRMQLYILDLSKNNFSGEIPKPICGMRSLGVLDFSRNKLNGSVPQCLSILIKRSLQVLNLGDNHLSGVLPEIFMNGSNLRSLNVGQNQLVGKLPRSFSGCSSLEVLKVERNRINDTFPFWLKSLQQLQVVILHSNEFHGSLQDHPKVASWFPQLRIIDISHNAFTGTLPSDYFMYWIAMSSERDGSELKYIGDFTYYQDSMVLANKGVELDYTKILTLFTAIDFSGNRLRGKIPESVGLLKNLIVLNLSSNSFSGNIPSSLANLTELESLDLSYNKLSGQIPPALGGLTSLSNITVSNNTLVGPIPQATQFQTQSASSFQGNLGLCGLPLSEKCRDVDTEQSQTEEEEEGVLSWTAAVIALAPGLIFGLTIGHIFITKKPQWFMKTNPGRRGSR